MGKESGEGERGRKEGLRGDRIGSCITLFKRKFSIHSTHKNNVQSHSLHRHTQSKHAIVHVHDNHIYIYMYI